MSHKTKEDRILEDGQNLIANIQNKYEQNDQLVEEYKHLLKNYKKIISRYKKTIKTGDAFGINFLTKNDKLQTFTKKKVLENASSIRKLKQEYNEEINKYKSIIKQLKGKFDIYSSTNNKINKELKTSKKETLTLKNVNSELESKVKILEEFNTPFETLLEQEILRVRHNAEPLVLAMIGIDNFTVIMSKIDEFTNADNFILGIYKYLQNSLKKSATVIYDGTEMFYIIMPYVKIENAIKTLRVIGGRRTISQNNITLSSGVTFLKNDDTPTSIITRCYEAYKDAMLDSNYLKVMEI